MGGSYRLARLISSLSRPLRHHSCETYLAGIVAALGCSRRNLWEDISSLGIRLDPLAGVEELLGPGAGIPVTENALHTRNAAPRSAGIHTDLHSGTPQLGQDMT